MSDSVPPQDAATLPQSESGNWYQRLLSPTSLQVLPLGAAATGAVFWLYWFALRASYASTLHVPMFMPEHSQMVGLAIVDIANYGIAGITAILLCSFGLFALAYFVSKKNGKIAGIYAVAFFSLLFVIHAGFRGHDLAEQLIEKMPGCVKAKPSDTKLLAACPFAPVIVTAKLRTDALVSHCGLLYSAGEHQIIVLTPGLWVFPTESFVDASPIFNSALCGTVDPLDGSFKR